ncbi:MAG: tRNA guanosine(34) transglycosylase Tgt [Planctomycetota bacterium]|jgi:queuine tRNA-ribosyltransferase
MTSPLSFTIAKHCSESGARLGRVETPHGGFDTPAFMPVGTRGTIRGLTPAQIAATGTQILLNNAYHLMLRPGAEVVAEMGGVHRFMGWDKPILTDSGGYQAYSMADINAVDDDGVTFKSVIDGSKIRLGPEQAIEVQNLLGPDIIMAFDDCPPAVDPVSLNEARRRMAAARGGETVASDPRRLREANERTVRWLDRCVRAHARPSEQALFGIVQGGTDLDLRVESLEGVCNIELPGYAIGGVAVGEGSSEIDRVVEFTAPRLPADKPRYLMGIGYERDLVMAVRAGVDMFDCVLPTRNGRNAHAFTRTGRLNLKNAVHKTDSGPIETGCECAACGDGFTRAYLRHLFMAGEMLGPILVSLHNIRHFQRLLLDIRAAIHDDSWSLLAREWPVLGETVFQPAQAALPAAPGAPDTPDDFLQSEHQGGSPPPRST